MGCFTIIVDFVLKPGARERFLELVRANAAASVRDEPGCRRFDVLVSGEPDRVVLYEIYEDETAFLEGHLKAPHFLAFRSQIEGLVESNSRREFREITENDKLRTAGR